MGRLIPIVVLLLWFGTAIYVLVLCQRKMSQRIRMWAAENGCAVIRLQYRYALGPIGIALSLTFWGVFRWGNWFVEIQDEQGGIRRGYVHFVARYLGTWFDVPWGKMHIEWR